MPASYPSAIKTFSTWVDNVNYPTAAMFNDLQLEVTAIETELGINAKGIYFSDTAPSSPVADQLWWETDTNILWTYGTYAAASRWVSAARMNASSGAQSAVFSADTLSLGVGSATVAGYDIYIETLYFKHHVITTNDGTKYWTATLRKVTTTTVPATAAGTSLGACNTSTSTAGTWTEVSASINAVIDGTGAGIEIPFIVTSKTSTPGDIWQTTGIIYRLVHP